MGHPGSATNDSVTSSGQMVDVPVSPVTQLPHQRPARSETIWGGSFKCSRSPRHVHSPEKNTSENASSPRFRTSWLAKVFYRTASARWLLCLHKPESHDASALGFRKGSYP